MRFLICGGRDFDDYAMLSYVLDQYDMKEGDTVIHGDAHGADRMAGKYATERGVPVEAYPAAWHLHGKHAGPIRNRKMLDEGKPDIIIAFPGGKGTANMIEIGEKAGVPVIDFSVGFSPHEKTTIS